MPQTEEHVQILDLLGVRPRAWSRSPTPTSSTRRRCGRPSAEVTARLAGTALEGSPVDPDGPRRRPSIAALRAALLDAAAAGSGGHVRGPAPAAAVDRPFVPAPRHRPGRDRHPRRRLDLGGRRRGGVRGRGGESPASVRGVHVNGVAAEVAEPGSRVGVALSRLEADPVRGDAVVLPGQWTGGRRWHVALQTVRDHPGPSRPTAATTCSWEPPTPPPSSASAATPAGTCPPMPTRPLLGRLHLRRPHRPRRHR